MDMIAKATAAMETILGTTIEVVAKKRNLIKRKRKFAGQTLLQVIVFSLLKKPDSSFEDMAVTASKLGITVSATAIEKRCNESLSEFLADVLAIAVKQLVGADHSLAAVFERFKAVYIGDSSSIALPNEMQSEYPGCGGTNGSGLAALKLQVRWDLKSGAIPLILIESGRASDAKSLIVQQPVEEGVLEIFDLGYFSLERFRRLDQAKASFISRFQHGTTVLDEQGNIIDLVALLASQSFGDILDLQVLLGAKEHLSCRLIAIRCPRQIADRRRQKAHEKASKHGRSPTVEFLALLDWTIYITNLPPDKLNWQEVVVLYRARWQIELLFKLWKSHNQIANHHPAIKPTHVKIRLWGKLIGVILQHWILLSAIWNDCRRSLMKGAKNLRNSIDMIILALNHPERMIEALQMLQTQIGLFSRVQKRKKHPSAFQLQQTPELLGWNA